MSDGPQGSGDITKNTFSKNAAASASSIYRTGCSGSIEGNPGLFSDDIGQVNPQ